MNRIKTALALATLLLATGVTAENIIRTPAPVLYVAPASKPVTSEPLSLTLQDVSLPDAMVGTAYQFDFTPLASWTGLTGEAPSLTWTAANALPEGLSVSSQGVLQGTPSEMATTSFEIVATYTDGSGRQIYTLDVGGAVFQATSIATDSRHTCAITPDGTVKCWGYNVYGQLGDGTNTNRNTPVPVSGLSGVTQMALGGFHSCATLSGGTVKCWGYNAQGQLGDGTTTSRRTAVNVMP